MKDQSAVDPHGLLQRVVDAAADLLDVGVAAIYRVEPGTHEAIWACDSGVDDEVLGGLIRTTRLPIKQEPVELAAVVAASAPLRLISSRPIVGSDTLVRGVLCLFDGPARRLASREGLILGALADGAALALENAELARRLDEVEARYRFLLDRLPDIMWAAGADRIFTYVSAGCERILGYRPDELIGRSSEIVMHESSRDAFEEGYRWQIAHPDADQTYRVNLRHKDGHPVPVELHNIGTPSNGKYGGGTGSVREMTERIRLERELQEQAAELAASRERARLAEELHDSVTQALFTMTITAGAARMLLERNAAGVDAKLDDLSSLSREALAEMRSLIFELRPGGMTDEGLVPALRKHLAAVEARTGLAIQCALESDPGHLSLAVEDALYRIAQEAVHNIVKHARAREVRIELGRLPDAVRLSIHDDGAGFDPRARTDGLGLAGMTARAARLGGFLDVVSTPNKGTTIVVTLPIEAEHLPDSHERG